MVFKLRPAEFVWIAITELLQRREKSVSSPLMERKRGLSRYSVILLRTVELFVAFYRCFLPSDSRCGTRLLLNQVNQANTTGRGRFLCLWPAASSSSTTITNRQELFNDWGGRGYDDSVPVEVTKTAPSGDRTT